MSALDGVVGADMPRLGTTSAAAPVMAARGALSALGGLRESLGAGNLAMAVVVNLDGHNLRHVLVEASPGSLEMGPPANT